MFFAYPVLGQNPTSTLESSFLTFTTCLKETTQFENTSSIILNNSEILESIVFSWDFGDGSPKETYTSLKIDNVSHTYKKPGEYKATLETVAKLKLLNNKLTDSFSGIVKVEPLPILDTTLGEINKICLGDILPLSSLVSGASNIEWKHQNDVYLSNSPEMVVTTDRVIIKASSLVGCLVIDTLVIKIWDKLCYIPTVFTPNDDVNDANKTWVIPGLNYFKDSECTVTVFTRTGIIVYTSVCNGASWNGKFKNIGEDLPGDTYYYVIKLPNEPNPLTGSVTILK